MRLIDLDTLKQNLCGECTMNFPKECRQIGCAKVDKQDILDALRIPVIDAVPVKHGKWIHEVRYTIDSLHSYQQYRCSKCGMTYITNTKYCPECGARMDEHD